MSLNFGQFPTPRLPLTSADIVVGYQLVGGVPTLAQYTMLQLFGGVFPGGVVPVTQGGTGLTSVATGSVLVGGAPTVLNTVAPAAAGTVLVSQGSGQIPLFSNLIITNGTTQPPLDNSTLVATDQFVNQQIIHATATVPFAVTGGTYNQASLGSGAQIVIFASGGVVSGVLTISNPGSGYAVGDLLVLPTGNEDAIVRVTGVSGSGITSVSIIYGGTGYTTGNTVTASEIPPGQRTVTLTGALTSNVTFILQNGTLNTASRRIQFNNNTTGAFTVHVFLSNGAGGTTGGGVILPQGTNNSSGAILETDGVNDVWLADTPLGIGAVSSTNPVITGGTINNTTVGATTPAAGTFTTLNSTGNDALMYDNASVQSLPSATATTITTWTKVYDRLSTNFAASTGIFTAPAAGFYHVDVIVTLVSALLVANDSFVINILVNGTPVIEGFATMQAAATAPLSVQASGVVQLALGQTITVQATQNTGSTKTLSASPINNTISIHKIP